jgi:hypothetical protein
MAGTNRRNRHHAWRGAACHFGGSAVKNPWGKKNPFLSMWLSGANAMAGAARSRVTAEAKRQTSAAITRGTKQATKQMTDALTGKPPAKKRRKR